MTPERIAELRALCAQLQIASGLLAIATAEAERLRAIVEAFVAHGTGEYDGQAVCHYCSGFARSSRGAPFYPIDSLAHEAGCVHVKARRALGLEIPWTDDGVRHEEVANV